MPEYLALLLGLYLHHFLLPIGTTTCFPFHSLIPASARSSACHGHHLDKLMYWLGPYILYSQGCLHPPNLLHCLQLN